VSAPRCAVDTVGRVYELRARAEGRVEQLVVDEGQMVAEEDAIAIVDSAGARVELTTDVPGVVRELYIERGQPVLRGEVIALIDES
jgi:multidrug efflux pump subunit AcrA (membrane-fusion protein)